MFLNLINLLDLPYDSGQNKIFFVKFKIKFQFRSYQIVSYLPCTQAKILVTVSSKVVAVQYRILKTVHGCPALRRRVILMTFDY